MKMESSSMVPASGEISRQPVCCVLPFGACTSLLLPAWVVGDETRTINSRSEAWVDSDFRAIIGHSNVSSRFAKVTLSAGGDMKV